MASPSPYPRTTGPRTPPTGDSRTVVYGVSGWDYRDWDGPLYPSPRPRGFRALPLLARFLDFVEVNVTYYRIPTPEYAERWAEETPPEFGFVLKAWQGWTHDDVPVVGREEVAAFQALLAPIEPARRWGVLAQYPPQHRDTPEWRDRLCQLRDAFAPTPLFVEVRDRRHYRRELFEFLQRESIAFVNVDLPEVRDLPRASTVNTHACTYLRLHGRNRSGWSRRVSRDERYDYHYPPEELAEIVEQVQRLETRAPRVLVAANNHFRAQAPAAVVALRSLVEGRPTVAPAALLETYPELDSYAEALDGPTD